MDLFNAESLVNHWIECIKKVHRYFGKKITRNSFWAFWSQNKKFTEPPLPSRCVTALGRVAGPLENYPKTDSELVEQGDPNVSPSNYTIENVVFGPAFETATQEMLNFAQPLNSQQTKY